MKINSPDEKWKIILAFASVYIIWGSTYLFILYSIETIPPLIMAGIRFVVVGGLFYLWALLKKERFNYELWRFGLITGFLMFLVGNGAVVLAEQNLPSGLVSIMAGTVPFWVLVLDKNEGKQRFRNGLTWMGLILGFGGLIILFADKLDLNQHSKGELFSYFIMIVGALGWTTGTLYSKHTTIIASTNAKVSVQTLSSGLLFILVSFFKGEWASFEPSAVSTVSWLSLGYLIFFGSLIGYYCFLWLLTKVSAHAVTTHAFVNPLVAVLLGTLFAGERFEANEFLALIFIIGGLVALYFAKNKR